VRLLICSIDKAEQIGLNWWRNDPRLTSGSLNPALQAGQLEERLDRIERTLEGLARKKGAKG
jgi:hypothetical protein